MVAGALAVEFPVAVHVHVRHVGEWVLDPGVVSRLLNVACELVLPEVVKLLLRGLISWSLVLLAGFCNRHNCVVGILHAVPVPLIVAQVVGHKCFIDPLHLFRVVWIVWLESGVAQQICLFLAYHRGLDQVRSAANAVVRIEEALLINGTLLVPSKRVRAIQQANAGVRNCAPH